jgi:hypothetical protein
MYEMRFVILVFKIKYLIDLLEIINRLIFIQISLEDMDSSKSSFYDNESYLRQTSSLELEV